MGVGVKFDDADNLVSNIEDSIENIERQIKYLQKAVNELYKIESPSMNVRESIATTEENIRCSKVDLEKLKNFKMAFKKFVNNAKAHDLEQSNKL